MDQLSWARRLLTVGLLLMAVLLGRLLWMAYVIWQESSLGTGPYAGIGGDLALVLLAFVVSAGLAGAVARARVRLDRPESTLAAAQALAVVAVVAGVLGAMLGWSTSRFAVVFGASLVCYGFALLLISRPERAKPEPPAAQ